MLGCSAAHPHLPDPPPLQRCGVCYTTVTQSEERSSSSVSTSGKNPQDLLDRQLAAVYLVNKLLLVPKEVCSRLLVNYGNPEEWTALCSDCAGIVAKGQQVFQDIQTLEKRHDNLRAQIKMKMKVKRELEEEDNEFQDSSAMDEIRQFLNNVDVDYGIDIDWMQATSISSPEKQIFVPEVRYERQKFRRSTRNLQRRVKKEQVFQDESEDDDEYFNSGAANGSDEDFTMQPISSEEEDVNLETDPLAPNQQTRKRKTQKKNGGKSYPKMTFQEVIEMRKKLIEGAPKFSKHLSVEDLKKRKQITEGSNRLIRLCERHQVTEFPCSTCLKVFKSFKEWREHGKVMLCQTSEVKNALPEVVIQALRCDQCQKPMSNIAGLEDHYRIIHSKKDILKCRGCSTVFKKVKQFQQHHEEVLKSDPSSDCATLAVYCPHTDFCPNVVSSSLETLEIHTKLYHTKPVNSALKCVQCNKTFSTMQYLKKHLERHIKIDVPCTFNQCTSTFTSQEGLKKHIKLVHLAKQEGAPRFPCSLCDKSFACKYRQALHEQTHTSETPHLCTVCGKSFKMANYLHVHMYIHDPEKQKKFGVYRQNQRDKGWVRKTKFVKKKKYYYPRKKKSVKNKGKDQDAQPPNSS